LERDLNGLPSSFASASRGDSIAITYLYAMTVGFITPLFLQIHPINN
jgi:hypothetical protein